MFLKFLTFSLNRPNWADSVIESPCPDVCLTVTCHLSHVTCHMSHVTCSVCHLSCQVMFFFVCFLTKWWSLSLEGLLSRGRTPFSLYFIYKNQQNGQILAIQKSLGIQRHIWIVIRLLRVNRKFILPWLQKKCTGPISRMKSVFLLSMLWKKSQQVSGRFYIPLNENILWITVHYSEYCAVHRSSVQWNQYSAVQGNAVQHSAINTVQCS